MGDTAAVMGGIAAFAVLLIVVLYAMGVFNPKPVPNPGSTSTSNTSTSSTSTSSSSTSSTSPPNTASTTTPSNATTAVRRNLVSLSNESTPVANDVVKYNNAFGNLVIRSATGTFVALHFMSKQYNTWMLNMQALNLTRKGVATALIPELWVSDTNFKDPLSYAERLVTLEMINELRIANGIPAWDGVLMADDQISCVLSTLDASRFMSSRFNADGTLWLSVDFAQ